jgi:hypothetical protein
VASYPPYMYTSLCPDRRYRKSWITNIHEK